MHGTLDNINALTQDIQVNFTNIYNKYGTSHWYSTCETDDYASVWLFPPFPIFAGFPQDSLWEMRNCAKLQIMAVAWSQLIRWCVFLRSDVLIYNRPQLPRYKTLKTMVTIISGPLSADLTTEAPQSAMMDVKPFWLFFHFIKTVFIGERGIGTTWSFGFRRIFTVASQPVDLKWQSRLKTKITKKKKWGEKKQINKQKKQKEEEKWRKTLIFSSSVAYYRGTVLFRFSRTDYTYCIVW